MKKAKYLAILRVACVATLIFLPFSIAGAQTFSWSALGLVDNDTIPSGSTIGPVSGVTMTVTTVRTTNGGMDSFTTYGDSEFSYDTTGSFGGLNNYFEVGWDNGSCDQNDTFAVLLSFSSPVNNLQFTIVDVDQSSWDDIIEIEANGQNIRPSFENLVTLGSDVLLDDEIFANGWEGNVSVPSANTTGNIVFDSSINQPQFAFNSVRITYYSGDDGSGCGGNPAAQRIGIGDITFSGTTTPVTLGHFDSSRTSAGVDLNWETVQEVGHAGFQIYGRTESQWTLLNDGLIQASNSAPLSKSSYQYSLPDLDETIEWLSLVDVSMNEEVVPHGPYKIGQAYGAHVVAVPAYDWTKVSLTKPSLSTKKSIIDQRLRQLLQDDEVIERAGGK